MIQNIDKLMLFGSIGSAPNNTQKQLHHTIRDVAYYNLARLQMCKLLWFGIAESSVIYIAKKEGSCKPPKATLKSVTECKYDLQGTNCLQ